MDISKLKPVASGQEEGEEGRSEATSKQAQEEQLRRDLLSTVLESEARERLSRIALVNPQLSQQIEGILVRMAQSGQLRSKVTDTQLIGLLDQASGVNNNASSKKGTIVFQRRKDLDDDDDDW